MVQFLSSLFQNETARLAKMPSSWWYDSQVNRALLALQERVLNTKASFELVWPLGEKELLADDHALIKKLKDDPNVNHIVVPMNTGNHWYPMCFRREPAGSETTWTSHILKTRMDGTCGSSTVEQVEKFVRQATAEAKIAAPTKVRTQANKNSKSIEEISVASLDQFDLNLARMAGLSGHELSSLTQTTALLFKSYDKQEQQRRLERLYQSGLGEKPAVANLIAQCLS